MRAAGAYAGAGRGTGAPWKRRGVGRGEPFPATPRRRSDLALVRSVAIDEADRLHVRQRFNCALGSLYLMQPILIVRQLLVLCLLPSRCVHVALEIENPLSKKMINRQRKTMDEAFRVFCGDFSSLLILVGTRPTVHNSSCTTKSKAR